MINTSPDRTSGARNALSRYVLTVLFGLNLVMVSGPALAAEPPKRNACVRALGHLGGFAVRKTRATLNSAWGLVRRMSPPKTLSPQEYAALKTRTVAEYFLDGNGKIRVSPESDLATPKPKGGSASKTKEKSPETPPERPVLISTHPALDAALRTQEVQLEGLKLDLGVTTKFMADLEVFLHNRRLIQGFRSYKGFKDWWQSRSEVYLNKPVVELLINERMTMGDFVDHLHLQYMANLIAQKNESKAFRFAKTVMRHPLAAGLVATMAVGTGKLIGFLWQLAVLGPGVQMVNAYTEPVVQPLSNAARQRGAQDLASAAEDLQEMLSGSEELNQFRRELETLTEDLKELPPEEAKERWDEFELMYFRIFQRHQQLLPMHLRMGRKLFHEFALSNPVYLASAMADFDIQYWTHDRAIREIERDYEGREIDETAMRRIQMHTQQRSAAESRMASTLAAWKMYEFIYPEFSRSSLNSHHRATLKGHYDKFRDNLKFELYQEQFSGQMETMLHELDFHYKLQLRLKDVKQAVENAEDAVTAPAPDAP